MLFVYGLIVGLALGIGGTVLLFRSVILPKAVATVQQGIQAAASAAEKHL